MAITLRKLAQRPGVMLPRTFGAGKMVVVGFRHRAQPDLYSTIPNFSPVKITVFGPPARCVPKVQEKYFCSVKFSTQMLISMWKSPVAHR